MVILVLYEQFSGKILFKFLTPILSPLPNMMHLVCTFPIMRNDLMRLIAVEKVQNYEKIVSYKSKTFLKMADGKMHIPHPTPLDPPLAISYRNHQKIQAYFSHLAPLV